MIIKHPDPKEPLLERLESIAADPSLPSDVRAIASRDLKRQRAGLRAEKEAAYELGFHFERSRNWALIHDLRIEHGGRVAQIDHLVINRLLQIHVLETKNFSEGVGVNEHGEFVQFYQSRPQGIASPVAQNQRHIAVLEEALSSGRVALPTRLGIKLVPNFHNSVVVSKTARISRPRNKLPEAEHLVKIDQLVQRLEADFEKGSMLKLVSPETLEALARAIASLHVPAPLPARPAPARPALVPTPALASAETAGPVVAQPAQPAEPAAGAAPQSKLVCATCHAAVPYAVAKFCWMNKSRFQGRVLCREHQG